MVSGFANAIGRSLLKVHNFDENWEAVKDVRLDAVLDALLSARNADLETPDLSIVSSECLV